MSSESFPVVAGSTIETRRMPIPDREHGFTRNRIIVARALWPRKTADHLAAKAGCSERAAKFYLAGRDWSHQAVRAIVTEIF